MANKVSGIHEVDPIMSLLPQVSALANQIASFTTKDAASRELAMVASVGHSALKACNCTVFIK